MGGARAVGSVVSDVDTARVAAGDQAVAGSRRGAIILNLPEGWPSG